MDDLSAVEPVRVLGGYVISADALREQIRWAQKNGHANCFFQKIIKFENGMDEEQTVVTVLDLFDPRWPTKSVTNDAEYVVHLAVRHQGNHPIVYRDTEGNWDELRHTDGVFQCFRPLNARMDEEAVDKVLALHELGQRKTS